MTPAEQLKYVADGLDSDLQCNEVRHAEVVLTTCEWVLTTLLEDPQFQVAIGGNPNRVERLLAMMHLALDLLREDRVNLVGAS